VAINVEQLLAVAEVTDGDTPAALVDAQSTIRFVFFEVQPRMARVRNKLPQRNIDPGLRQAWKSRSRVQ
jgi:hypothetical protein